MRRKFKSKRLGGLEIDDELKLRRLLDRHFGGICALDDAVNKRRRTVQRLRDIRAIDHEAAGFGELAPAIHRRQAMLGCELGNSAPVVQRETMRKRKERVGASCDCTCEGLIEVTAAARFDWLQDNAQLSRGGLGLT